MSTIRRVFLDVDMRNSHDGLNAVAIKNHIHPDSLEPGDFLVFLNTEKNKIKILTANGVMAYYRSPHGKLELGVIRLIPQAFKASGRIDYDASLKQVIEANFRKVR